VEGHDKSHSATDHDQEVVMYDMKNLSRQKNLEAYAPEAMKAFVATELEKPGHSTFSVIYEGRRTSMKTPGGALRVWLCGLGTVVVLSAGLSSAGQQSATTGGEGGTPLFDNLGKLHHPISTDSPKAQQYFDQGLRLVFAFNHEEAINSFEEAARLDPKAAMAYWGIALALGPNINRPMDRESEKRAYDAVQKARAQAPHVSSKEQAYIEALSVRYSTAPDSKREALDAAYAGAMGKVWAGDPKDADAGTLYAEALMDLQPWDYWTSKGRPKGRATEIVATLERALQLNPDHPGACHYYIHAVEASPKPERALACAKRLPQLVPGAGHLVHMPGHIYLRLGMYKEAVERNVHASSVDHDYLAHRKLTGMYPMAYYPHNVHFLWSALTMEGRSREAMKAAHDLRELVPLEAARQEPALEEFTSSLPFALVRFGKWDDVLALPKPPTELTYTTAIWRYARGMAFAATKRFDEAQQEHQALAQLAGSIPQDRTMGVTRVVDLARIAERVLAGEIAARRGQYEQAIELLEAAAKLEDALRYYEPPLWHIPVRHSLGAVLLQAGRPAEAEKAYRIDLMQHPHNGWALFGLKQSLRAQQKMQDVKAADQEFQKAWARADLQLNASRF
jgi:tetratricopeptide (TPR) repeat protein